MTNKTLLFFGVIVSMVVIFWQRKNIAIVGDQIMKTSFTRSEFVQNYAPIAKAAAKGTGLFPSVFMAQAILESNNGNSSLTKEANNFFGIKADKSWTGDFVVKPTTEYVNGAPVKVDAKFRKYPTPTASFLDRVNFLKTNSRYKNNGVFIAVTPEQQATALQKAGYATDPNYSNLLISLINSNNLKQYDV